MFWFLQNPVNSGENLDSKKKIIWLTTILSNILDEWEKALTGQQFFLRYSSSFFNTGFTSTYSIWFGEQPLSDEILRTLVSIEM